MKSIFTGKRLALFSLVLMFGSLLGVTPAKAELTVAMKVIGTFDVGIPAQKVAVNPDTNRLFMTWTGADRLVVYNTATRQKISELPFGTVYDVKLDRDTNKLYVSDSGLIKVFDASTLQLQKTLQFPDVFLSCFAVNSRTGKLYANGPLSYGWGYFSIIDIDSGQLLKQISYDNGWIDLTNVEMNRNLNRVYASGGYWMTRFMVLDANSETITQQMSFGWDASQLFVNENNNRIYSAHVAPWYVTCFRSCVDNGSWVNYAPVVSPRPIVYGLRGTVDPATNDIYACGNARTGEAAVSYHTNASAVPKESLLEGLTGSPCGIAFNSASKEIFVANNEGTVAVVKRMPNVKQGLTDLLSRVTAVLSEPGVPSGINTSMTNKLDDAIALYEAGNYADAIARLTAFVNQTRAQAGKTIPDDTATLWLADANQLLEALNTL